MKKTIRFLSLILICALSLSLFACGKETDEPTTAVPDAPIIGEADITEIKSASERVTTAVTEAPEKTTADGKTGIPNGTKSETFIFTGNPTTGYLWEYSVDNSGIIKVALKEDNSNNPEMPGASKTTYTYTVTGVKAGEVTLTFKYLRPWDESSVEETHIYKITVDEKQRINCEEIKG